MIHENLNRVIAKSLSQAIPEIFKRVCSESLSRELYIELFQNLQNGPFNEPYLVILESLMLIILGILFLSNLENLRVVSQILNKVFSRALIGLLLKALFELFQRF